MNTEETSEKLIPGGIMFALVTQRKELLGMTMRNLRKQAAEGTLTGVQLEQVLNALEGVCETLIEDGLERRGFGSDMDDEDGEE
jgi:hypothetical protein